MQNLRGNEISMVYQEPTSSLNPSMAIKRQLIEVFDSHNLDIGAAQAYERILSMLADVNIQDPERVLSAYPYQLSGGQQQRIVIAMALLTNPSLLILDEPTTGLHFEDVKMLLPVLHHLVEKGNTVLVIEHNLDVIKTADWIIDLGPEGGDSGGEIIAEGTPEDVCKIERSYTGQFLKTALQ